MSVKGMMQTVLVTELKQIQPDISNEALQYVVDNFSQVFDVREILAEENQELFQSNKNLNMALQKVSDYNLRLENERDAFSAQVSIVKAAYGDLVGAINNLDETDTDNEEMWGEVFAVMQNGWNSFNREPQQYLAEIKAEAGRTGFIAGVNWAESDELPLSKDVAAKLYAAKVRQGGAV